MTSLAYLDFLKISVNLLIPTQRPINTNLLISNNFLKNYYIPLGTNEKEDL